MIALLLLVISAILLLRYPFIKESTPIEPVPLMMKNPRDLIKEFFSMKRVDVQPNVPEYALPLNPDDISNFDQVVEMFPLDPVAREKFLKNGFLVMNWYEDEVVTAYRLLSGYGMPIYVTSDSMLHLYHIQFDHLLSDIEENNLFPTLIELTDALLGESEEQYSSLDGPLKEAARRNVAYFSVAMKLLDESYRPPSYVSEEVSAEIKLIEEHQGFFKSPIFGYEEDYSQYVPRGHYTKSETLKRYFKAMMWYGRMAFLIKGGRTIPEEEARRLTVQASLIVTAMQVVKEENKSLSDIWSEIYAVTSFFVGFADDLTPYEYIQAIREVFGSEFVPENLSETAMLDELRGKLLEMRAPLIFSGTGNCYAVELSPEELDECLEESMGMRFLGQRFVPDSYVFQRLVAPSVGLFTGEGSPFTLGYTPLGPTRVFPRGLDFMAVLGSEEALRILHEEGDVDYERYTENLEDLRAEFSGLNESEWGRNLYWAWLYTLKALIEPRGEGYPSYMRTQAWERRQLHAALASWAELRHDTILYAKQSYTPLLASAPVTPKGFVYVEPVPEVYSRLSSLVEMTRRGLKEMGFLNQTQEDRLLRLKNVLDMLVEVSKKELEMRPLDDEEAAFLEQLPDELEAIVEGLDERSKSTILVADVHTDQNSRLVLEEGVGNLDLLLVVVPTAEGKLIIAAGPSLSYYEFKQPMADRLTDEAWRQVLGTKPPNRPEWISCFFQPGFARS